MAIGWRQHFHLLMALMGWLLPSDYCTSDLANPAQTGLTSKDLKTREDTLTCIGELAKAIPQTFEGILQRDFTE